MSTATLSSSSPVTFTTEEHKELLWNLHKTLDKLALFILRFETLTAAASPREVYKTCEFLVIRMDELARRLEEETPFSIDTYLSWVLLTNDASPVKLESGDRRYCVFHTGAAHKGDHMFWNETAALFERDEVAGAVFAYLQGLELSDFVVTAFPVTTLREIMIENERSVEEMFLTEIAGELEGDEWRGSGQAFYQLYADWCKRFEIRPKTAVTFGRDLTPFVLKGWVGSYKSNGVHGRIINISEIKKSGRAGRDER